MTSQQADERQVPGAEYVAKLRGHGPEHGPLAETKCNLCGGAPGSAHGTPCVPSGPLPEDVAANADAERAYEARQAQVRDRDLCACRDQQAAHSGAPVGMTRGCMVEACPCTKFRASGDNLEQSLEAMDDSDEAGELDQWRRLGWEVSDYPPSGTKWEQFYASPSWLAEVRQLLTKKDGMDALERDVVALPPDGSPQQRWLGDAQALTRALHTLAKHGGDDVVALSVQNLHAHLDTMPAPFDWDAVGKGLAEAYPFSEAAVGAQLKRLWLGGTHAGD